MNWTERSGSSITRSRSVAYLPVARAQHSFVSWFPRMCPLASTPLRKLPAQLALSALALLFLGVQDGSAREVSPQDPGPVVLTAAEALPSVPAASAVRTQVALAPLTPDGAVAMSDQELGQVSAGDFEVNLGTFDVLIDNNQAGMFTLDIARSAFGGAQGLFTTLQAVNSAVDLTVIVNIFLNQTP